jgi:hypothetical protein
MSFDRWSVSTVPITPYFDGLKLSEATGFIWRRNGRFYLITNWHVVSALAEGGSRPNKLRCHFVRAEQRERELIDVPIRDQNNRPLWLVHFEQDTRAIDVVAIPLDDEDLKAVTLFPVNELAPAKLAIMIGMDVFILGYPFGSKPPALPVWKRGSIASEPDLVRHSTGYYLVDTASRPGMSGSPVILRSWSNHILESNMWTTSNEKLPIDRIIGVYSGRLIPTDAQIGIVWHVDYIEQIIDGGMRDT